MYPVFNNNNIYVDEYEYNRHLIKRIGDEKALIIYLAQHYIVWRYPWDEDSDPMITNRAYNFGYWNDYSQSINPYDYQEEAWKAYCDNPSIYADDSYIFRQKIYHKVYDGSYIYRQTPVPHTAKKWRGGDWAKPCKLKPIFSMYSNPEYKEFNRGSKDDYGCGWWDERHRCVQRSWKTQRKHQYKE